MFAHIVGIPAEETALGLAPVAATVSAFASYALFKISAPFRRRRRRNELLKVKPER